MIYLTVSTGIGGGIIIGGKLVRGAYGDAGEVGHMILNPEGPVCGCGNHGCWETLSSGTAISREVEKKLGEGVRSIIGELAGGGKVRAEHVFQAKNMGDSLAEEVIDKAVYFLALGISNLVNVINPERVVIGGGVANAGQALFQPLQERVEALSFGPAKNVEIVPAALGGDAGVIGAAALAFPEM